MVQIQIFLYLQVLDFLTTLIGLRMGLSEASPFIRWLMQIDPAVGLGLSKLIALALAGLCLWLNKRHLVRWINYWYAGLVIWNMAFILVVLRAG